MMHSSPAFFREKFKKASNNSVVACNMIIARAMQARTKWYSKAIKNSVDPRITIKLSTM